MGAPKVVKGFQPVSLEGVTLWVSDRVRPEHTVSGVLKLGFSRFWGFRRLTLKGGKSILDSCGGNLDSA